MERLKQKMEELKAVESELRTQLAEKLRTISDLPEDLDLRVYVGSYEPEYEKVYELYIIPKYRDLMTINAYGDIVDINPDAYTYNNISIYQVKDILDNWKKYIKKLEEAIDKKINSLEGGKNVCE